MSYLEILQSHGLTQLQWVAIGLAAFILGFSKSGIKGIGIIIILILAFVFGEKASTGILLPMLISADIVAVSYYNRHTQWRFIKKLIPSMVVGVLVGVWVGDIISEIVFKRVMAVIIIASLGIMLFFEKQNTNSIPKNKVFSNSAGFLAGFTTMIGNLAGPISNIYFLAIRLPKNEFIGTGAWLFFIINVFKLPFHFFVWKTVTKESLVLNLTLVPIILVGFFIGATLVKKISNVNYRKFIIIVTAIGGVIMLFR
ncbi:sulfite exporter TauE/SafE family protein [Hyunsoonleella pacifica]|uniref:Probable membrane transporter protein n=1 Tax=Hyunsoonleella pacifica TaxID=1080224 RepID=A0A4Q9FRL1_9FLAO|nr:sulfite exporter TauE/SafE family protein [Hyunsoonleella pacifica]TBN16304.1 sulfite exporter TauE/SafE family protein [Hyunsoonleella pacifica]GGD20576.1 anion permease [Hyunsoonleella pacifica]